MMKWISAFTISLCVLSIASCRNSPVKPELTQPSPTKMDPTLAGSMRNLEVEMNLLLPYLVNPKRFNAPENRQRIQDQLIQLQKVSTNVTHSPAMQEQDPTLSSLSRGFKEEMIRARSAFNMGHIEYARGSLLNVTSYCIECHTRTASGPAFQNVEVEQELRTLKPLDRAEYLLAMRQYDAALKELDEVLKVGTEKGTSVLELERAARLALMTTVRYKSNPDSALKVVDQILDSKNMPFYLKSTANTWKRSLKSWKKESKKMQKDLVGHSQKLVNEARKLQQDRDDRAGDIQLMRVQALLLPVVLKEKEPARLGQSLYLLGVAYEGVKDLAMWSLHEDYYESCIRQVPHSEWSAQCFKSLKESLMLGYTGSAGTSLPPEVSQLLGDLEKIAL